MRRESINFLENKKNLKRRLFMHENLFEHNYFCINHPKTKQFNLILVKLK